MQERLNAGVLPSDYYAQAEQFVGPLGPDVLTLQMGDPPQANDAAFSGDSGGIAVSTAPPRAKLISELRSADILSKRRTLAIRHVSGDRVVALIELVSPGNKAGQFSFRSFIDKAVEAVNRGYHLLIVDLFPPTSRDPHGVHAAIWTELGGEDFTPPADAALTLVSYSSGYTRQVYLESTAVGRELLEMPLFLEPETYVNVPLEEMYSAAWRGVPRKWKEVLEGGAAAS